MKKEELETRMRRLEWFHGLRALDETWPIIRVDGRSFSRFTEERFDKPFDIKFHECMIAACEALLEELQGVYAYTESDEISILLPNTTDLFDREVEKLVSVSAGIGSATFTHKVGVPAHFDSRLCLAATASQVVDYFRWRQADATRCCLNGWCYWTLRKEGQSVKAATQALVGKSVGEKNELLFARSINFNDLPVWQKRGSGLYWETYPKKGVNPVTGEEVVAERRRVKVDENIPKGEDYDTFILSMLSSSSPG